MRVDHHAATALVFAITACASRGMSVAGTGERPQVGLWTPAAPLARAPAGMPVHCPASVPYMPVARVGEHVDPFMPRGTLAPSPCRDSGAEPRMAVLQPGDSVAIIKRSTPSNKVRTGDVPR